MVSERNLLSRPPGMKDVAARAGVSHQTVSRVINQPSSVSPKTRERVQRAIVELGYRPNSAARALVTQRSGLLGIIGPTQVFYGPSTIQYSLELAAHDYGYMTVNSPLEEFTIDALHEAIGRLSSLSVEAIVLIEPLETLLSQIPEIDSSIPIVGTLAPALGEKLGIPTATMDDAMGERLLVDHLYELGHRRIGHLTGAFGWYEVRERAEAYDAAMAGYGLPTQSFSAGSWNAQDAYEVAMTIPHEDLPTAFIADNDELAAGLIRALHRRGLRVPEDISVVGFDDMPSASYLSPSLTTIRQDFTMLGRSMVDLACNRIDGGDIEHIRLPVEIVTRESSAPPRQ